MFPRNTVGTGQAITAAPFLKVSNTSPQTQAISTLPAWWKVCGVNLLGSSVWDQRASFVDGWQRDLMWFEGNLNLK